MKHIVTLDEDNLRADKIIREFCSGVGYGLLQKLFRLRKVKVNGKAVIAFDKLHAGDVVEVFADLHKTETINSGFNRKLFDRLRSMIVYENENFFAINKPTKLAVQLGTKISICVETFIKSYPNCNCHLVHRLDKDTSGVLLIAKSKEIARKLTALFRENKIKKTYIAIVDGQISQPGKIDNLLEKSFIGNEEKMRVSSSGARAITLYTPLKLIGSTTMLELTPLTGRKHQLRVHCADILKAPILGDIKYHENPQHKELFLHAYEILIDEWKIKITAQIPDHFKKII